MAKAGITGQEALVELACRLFDIGRLELWPAAQLAGMTRMDFEAALARRRIPIYRPTIEDFQNDLEILRRLEQR